MGSKVGRLPIARSFDNAKTGARNRAQAVAYAYRNGLAPDARQPGA